MVASIKYIGKQVPREFSEMIAGCHAVVQALLGTLLTWSLTAAGAALVFVFDGSQVCVFTIQSQCNCFIVQLNIV